MTTNNNNTMTELLLLRVLANNEAPGKDPHQIRAMLANGANIMARDPENGRTALHYAVANYCPLSVIRALIDWGAMVNAPDDAGMTPLHICCAIKGASTMSARLLMDHGAELFAKDKEGKTPKCRAAGDPRLVSTLLLHKKKIDAFVMDNEQLIAIVGHKNRMKIEKLIQEELKKTSNMALITMKQQIKEEIVASIAVQTMEQQQHPPKSLLSRWKTQETEDMPYNGQEDFRLQQQQHHGQPPAKKRKKWVPTDNDVASTSPGTAAVAAAVNTNNNDSCFPKRQHEVVSLERMSRLEEELQEQRAEMVVLREMLIASRDTTETASKEIVVSTSKLYGKVKVEQEEEINEEHGTEEDVDDALIGPTAEELRDDKINVMLATIKQELQNVNEKLEASREMAIRYKKERDDYKAERNHYKKKVEQLHQLTGQM